VGAGFDGAGGHVQRGGDVGDGLLGQVSAGDEFAVPGGYEGKHFGGLGPVGCLPGDVGAGLVGDAFVDFAYFDGSAAGGAPVVGDDAAGDAVQPAFGGAGVGSVGVAAGPGAGPRFGGKVFGQRGYPGPHVAFDFATVFGV